MRWTYLLIYAGAGWFIATWIYAVVERIRIRRLLRREWERDTVEGDDAPVKSGRAWKFEGFK